MTLPPYDCDPVKAAANLRKHRVSFDEGYAVLLADPAACLDLCDDDHPSGEERWIRIGPHPAVPSALLHVTWTERNDRPRLISVRKATAPERRHHADRHQKPA